MKATSPFFLFLRFVSKKHKKDGSKNSSHNSTPQKYQKVVPGTRVGYQNGAELTSESPKIHKMLQKSCFLTLPFFKQISRHKNTYFGRAGTHGKGTWRRVPPSLEGDHHVTKWSWVECGNLGRRGTPSPGLEPRGGFQCLRLMPPTP